MRSNIPMAAFFLLVGIILGILSTAELSATQFHFGAVFVGILVFTYFAVSAGLVLFSE